MKRQFLLLLLIGFISSPAYSQFTRKVSNTAVITQENSREAEEYAVYNALIEARYVTDKTKLIVINDQTDSSMGRLKENYAYLKPGRDYSEYLKMHMPKLSTEMISDFAAQNEQNHLLKPLFDLSIRYVFISDDEINEIFYKFENGWERYYERYPNSQGTMTLSRVGFNSEMDKAFVEVGNQSHNLAGAGYFVFLEKENGVWTITDSIRTWMS